MTERAARIAFWVVSRRGQDVQDLPPLRHGDPESGVTNYNEVWEGRYRVWDERGVTPPYLDDVRYERFEPAPRHVSPSSFHPDYVANKLKMASPQLFGLLDQPRGSLQGWPTDTVWFGEDPPDWSYLWLCFVPRVPAVDLDRSDVTVEHLDKDGTKVPRISQRGALRLLDDLDPPCGLFRAAEDGSILIATDAVAEAVVRAGCTGIEFLDPATAFVIGGDKMCRGSDGPEPRLPEPDYPDPYAPRPWDADLSPVGPPVVWDTSPVDWFDWEPADTELEAPTPSPESGRPGEVLAEFLGGAIYFSTSAVEKALTAIADVQAGRSDLHVFEWPGCHLVVRPDAAWVRTEHAYPGDGPYPFPLDGMAAVIKRWCEAIGRAPNPLA